MIDVTFDFQAEAQLLYPDKDAPDSDRWSPTLQLYHKVLWSKPLPNGTIFTLEAISQNRLLHRSEVGEFILSSDRAVRVFQKKPEHKTLLSQQHGGRFEEFQKLSDTIGGIVLWPSRKIDNKITINGARGFNQFIYDRLDLTLECIRRYYLNQESPLYKDFVRYSEFFRLFGNFRGYVDFFLLQDMVAPDYQSVKIAQPYDNFATSRPGPRTVDEYIVYMEFTGELVRNRNKRIDAWQKNNTLNKVS